jgi:hypothetical protein
MEGAFFMPKKRKEPNALSELPLGLAMSLAQNEDAMKNFSNLTEEKKSQIISFIQSSATGAEAKHRVLDATDGLAHNSIDFLG